MLTAGQGHGSRCLAHSNMKKPRVMWITWGVKVYLIESSFNNDAIGHELRYLPASLFDLV